MVCFSTFDAGIFEMFVVGQYCFCNENGWLSVNEMETDSWSIRKV